MKRAARAADARSLVLRRPKMVRWIFCQCGKIIDEFESKCHWCGRPLSENEKDWDEIPKKPQGGSERQLELF
jgi:hypothetical protein